MPMHQCQECGRQLVGSEQALCPVCGQSTTGSVSSMDSNTEPHSIRQPPSQTAASFMIVFSLLISATMLLAAVVIFNYFMVKDWALPAILALALLAMGNVIIPCGAGWKAYTHFFTRHIFSFLWMAGLLLAPILIGAGIPLLLSSATTTSPAMGPGVSPVAVIGSFIILLAVIISLPTALVTSCLVGIRLATRLAERTVASNAKIRATRFKILFPLLIFVAQAITILTVAKHVLIP